MFDWVILTIAVLLVALLVIFWSDQFHKKGRWMLLTALTGLSILTGFGFVGDPGIPILKELFKVLVTALTGYASFLFYQLHKERDRKNVLVLILDKLKNELQENFNRLAAVSQMYVRRLEMNELYHGDAGLYRTCMMVNQLNNFVGEVPYEEDGKFLGFVPGYTVFQEMAIESLRNHMEQLDVGTDGDEMEYGSLKSELEHLEKWTVFDQLEEILVEIDKAQSKIPSSHLPAFDYLRTEIKSFLSFSEEVRKNRLDHFLPDLLDLPNPFSNTLSEFKELKILNKELGHARVKASTVPLTFEQWGKVESDKIAAFDAELYLDLSAFYSTHSSEEISMKNMSRISDLMKDIMLFNEQTLLKPYENLVKKVRRAKTFS